MAVYPKSGAARDRFVLDRRRARAEHDPWRYQDVLVEEERAADGHPARTATVFLTGRECPWRCVMCDLLRYTTEADTPAGANPPQAPRGGGALAGSGPAGRDHQALQRRQLLRSARGAGAGLR